MGAAAEPQAELPATNVELQEDAPVADVETPDYADGEFQTSPASESAEFQATYESGAVEFQSEFIQESPKSIEKPVIKSLTLTFMAILICLVSIVGLFGNAIINAILNAMDASGIIAYGTTSYCGALAVKFALFMIIYIVIYLVILKKLAVCLRKFVPLLCYIVLYSVASITNILLCLEWATDEFSDDFLSLLARVHTILFLIALLIFVTAYISHSGIAMHVGGICALICCILRIILTVVDAIGLRSTLFVNLENDMKTATAELIVYMVPAIIILILMLIFWITFAIASVPEKSCKSRA